MDLGFNKQMIASNNSANMASEREFACNSSSRDIFLFHMYQNIHKYLVFLH